MRAVIFDMDGVIVDSELHWKERETDIYKKLIPSWTREDSEKLTGFSERDLYKYLVENYDLNIPYEELRAIMEDVAVHIYSKRCSLLPGVLELIKELNNSRIPTSICSSSPRNWISMVMDRFSLHEYFKDSVSVDETGCKGKPDPDIYLNAAERLSISPSECVAIEDSEKGLMAAKNAGMKVIGIKNGFNNHENLSRADLIINGFKELNLERIEKL